MFDATELCRQVGIQQAALDAWIEAGHPVEELAVETQLISLRSSSKVESG